MKKLLTLLLLVGSYLAYSQPTGLNISNKTTNSPIGTAAATYEVNALLNFNQTTPGITLTVPTPTNTAANKNITFVNVGSVPFTLSPGGIIQPGQNIIGRWSVDVNGIAGWNFGGPFTINQDANTFLAAPSTGAGYSTYRTITTSDLPITGITAGTYNNVQFNTNGLAISGSNIGYLTSESDPIWSAASVNYYTKTQSDARYLQSFTETDPTVPSNVKAITVGNISNWDAAFGWGNHAGLYPLLLGTYNNPSFITGLVWSKIFSTPTSLSGYGITDPIVLTTNSYSNPSWITSLANSKITYSGTTSQYVRGDGSLATFPTINNGTVTSVGVTSSTLNVTNTPVTANGNINIEVPAQSFNTNPNRAISNGTSNTFTISSTRDASVTYAITFAVSLTLATSNGLVTLEYSTDGGTTWNIVDVASQIYSLAVTLQYTQTFKIGGIIPANALVRIFQRTATNVTIARALSPINSNPIQQETLR